MSRPDDQSGRAIAAEKRRALPRAIPGRHWVIQVIGGLALFPLLAGCILTPGTVDSAVPVPPRYTATTGLPHGSRPRPDWWRGFRSPELSRFVETAQAENLDIAAAIARILQADAQSRIAGAPLLPFLGFNGSVERSRSPGTAGRSTFTAVLNASYELDFWGKNRSALQAAELTAVASRFDRDVIVLSSVASVMNTYFQILAAQDRLRIARDNLRNASGVLEVIRQRIAAGTGNSLDLAQQESIVAQQRAAIPPLDQTLRQSIATLAVLLGRPPEGFAVKGGSMSNITIPRVSPGLPSELLLQRPDIREAETQLASAEANVASARAAMLPSISLTGQGGFQSSALVALLRPESALYSVAANLAQPIFDGYLLRSQLELQKGRRAELLENYRKAVLNGFADVERALIALRDLAEQERLQGEAVTTARRAYQLSEEQLRVGTIDITTVLNTQRTYFQAQDILALVRLTRLQAAVGMFQALGGGWDLNLSAIARQPPRIERAIGPGAEPR